MPRECDNCRVDSATRTRAGLPGIAVFAPSTLATVTIEDGGAQPEIHFHAGGQGVWVAHMAAELGAEVSLSTVLGGESGRLLSGLLEAEHVTVHAVHGSTANGVYVHDRRRGKRVVVAQTAAPRLQRHELDELYGIALTEGLRRGVACLTGPQRPGVLEPSVYARLSADLRRNGATVVADLTGPPLEAALEGGIDVLKLSEAELVAGEWADGTGVAAIVNGLRRLERAGAHVVIASRGPRPAIAVVGGRLLELRGPRFTAAETGGTGDAMVGAIAVSLARGQEVEEALRLGAAAGAINATRHGLGTGCRGQVESLARGVTLRPFAAPLPAANQQAGTAGA